MAGSARPHPGLLTLASFFHKTVGTFCSSLLSARGQDPSVTIKGASILKDADHWGQHILMAERRAGLAAENPVCALGPDPLCSALPWNPPDHTLGRAEGGESAFQRGDSVTLDGQLKDTRQL